MESVKKVLDEFWNKNPEMHHSKHCIYQGKKLEEAKEDSLYPESISELFFQNNETYMSYLVERFNLPYQEIGERITFPYDKFETWEGNDKYIISIREEYSKEKNEPIRDMSKEDRFACLAAEDDHGIKKIYYRMPVESGDVREEVFYEWIK